MGKWQQEHPEEHNAYRREWYKGRKHQEVWRVKKRKLELRVWFNELRSSMSCSLCGENHPATLDFHHRNPSDKGMEITTMVSNGYSKKRILDEVAKCDILCSNCHRKLHWGDEQTPS